MRRIGLVDFLGVFLVASLVVAGGGLAGDPGLGWHLKTGEIISNTWTVPRTDPFLTTTSGAAWIPDQWLGDLIFWQLVSVGGLPLLHCFTIFVVVATYAGIAPDLLRKVGGTPLRVFLVSFLTVLVGSLQWFSRPVIFSFLFFAVVFSILYRGLADGGRSCRRYPLLSLPFLFALWCLLHPGFILGFGLVAAYSCQCLLWNQRIGWRPGVEGILLLLCCIGVTLLPINPFGFDLYRSIFALGSSEYFMNLNAEWFSVDFYQPLFLPMLLVLIVLSTLVFSFSRGALNFFDISLVGGLVFLSLMHLRYMPFLAVVLGPAVLKLSLVMFPVGESFGRGYLSRGLIQAFNNINRKQNLATQHEITAAIGFLLLVFVAVQGTLPLRSAESSSFPSSYPAKEVDYLIQRGRIGPIFHTPDFGGYLTWRLWPHWRAYIDDRNQLLAKEYYEQFFIIDGAREGWRELFDRYGFRWALLQHSSPLRLVLETDPEWELVMNDGAGWLFRLKSDG